jgi:hypothetical protein
VSKSKNPPIKAKMITIQMYFAALRKDCSTGRYLTVGINGWEYEQCRKAEPNRGEKARRGRKLKASERVTSD